MKKFILAALCTLPLTLLAQQRASADNCCTPLYRVGISIGLVFRGWCGCDRAMCNKPVFCCRKGCGTFDNCMVPSGVPCCPPGGGGGGGTGWGPWYNYWPLPAHFQTPAPTGYPYWPAPQTWGGQASANPLPGMGGYAAATTGMQDFSQAQPVIPQVNSYGGYPMAAPVQHIGYYHQAPSYWYGQ